MPQALKVATLIQFLGWVIPHFPLLALWGNNNFASQYEVVKVGNFSEEDGLKVMQMVQFECPRHSKLLLSFNS